MQFAARHTYGESVRSSPTRRRLAVARWRTPAERRQIRDVEMATMIEREGLTAEEVSARLGISVRTIRRRMARVRAYLRSLECA